MEGCQNVDAAMTKTMSSAWRAVRMLMLLWLVENCKKATRKRGGICAEKLHIVLVCHI